MLAHIEGDVTFHELHKKNADTWKDHPLKLYDVRSSKARNRLLIAAMSFRQCKPLHAQAQTGFYDKEIEMEIEWEDDKGSEGEPQVRRTSNAFMSGGLT